MTYYERIMQNRSRKPTLSPAASLYAKKEDEEKKNKGGLLGGIGYLAHKLGLGFLQGIEGVWDYAAGGIADLFGGDDWAKDQFESDWFNYNAADDWFDPGEGWKVAGDVAGGMGTSLPGMLTAAGLTIATGGTAAPAALGLLVGSLSAAGTSTKEAMQQSGELTGKEYLYGAGMGAVEAVTEKLSGGLGTGITKAAKSVGKAFGKVAAKETAEAAVKSAAKKGVALSLKTAAKQAGKEFASEAFEEGFSEWIAPYIARVTYDPSAENATPGQILYSALIGGLSGVGMAGTTGAFVQYKNYRSGKSIEGESRAQQIIDLARIYTDETASNAEEAVGIRELYAKLASDVESGAALSTEQKRKLGELNAFETAVQLSPMVQRSAIGVIGSADAVAERLNAAGRYKIVDGRLTDTQSTKVEEGATVRDITAEDIRGKYDAKNKGSLAKELRENDVLRYLAASDAAGRLMMGAEDVEKSVLSGTPIQSQADLNEFITKASAEKKAAVGKELGIEDWNTLTVQEFANKASAYRESGKAEAYVRKTENIKKMREIESTKARNIPRAIALADGAAAHYADADSDFAIARSGDTFTVYDYTTGNVTREMTRAEVNAELARYRESKSATTEMINATSENFSSDAKNEIKDEKISKTAFENEFSEEKSRPTVKEIKAANEAKEQAKRFDALAKEKIKDYDGLSEANKSMIRKIFREAEASGISEADALSYARVSARTGLDIAFDKKACYKAKNKSGEDVYHAGFYDPESNRIVVNPETKRKHAALLIHELSHAIRSYRTKSGETKYFIDENAKISEVMWKKIKKYYADENGKLDAALAFDEASAYYAEQMLGTDAAIDLLLGEKPTLKQKILSFFKQSARDYSSDEALSREARRCLRDFKKTFDAFAARNYGRNAEAGNVKEQSARRAAMEVSGDVASKGRYTEPTDIKTIIKDIEAQNEIENMMPEGLSKDFVKAIKRSGGFAHPRLYRGMEAAELDSIIENGYIKSNSSYNFANQQGQTRFTPKIQTALSYATGFAPAGIREKFYEQGMPAYIVEIVNYTDLGIKNEDTIESYTVKNVDKKYITRIIELTYDSKDDSIKATDIEIDGMNTARGETVHGIPAFMRDSVTGTILYEHQDEDGFEDGKYISEKNPDILFDYDMVESYKESTFDYNSYLGISGDEQNLVPYGQDMKTRAVSFMNELSLAENVDRILHMDDNEALANKKAGSYISISKSTPSFILEKVKDAKNLELIMRFDSFYLATRHSGVLKGHYHNYGKIMSKLPEIISRPLAIVRMNDGRLNILSEVKTEKGNTSVISIELNTTKEVNNKYGKYNLIVTVTSGKDNYVRNNLQNRGVKVEYEKEDLPQVNSQLHDWLTIVNGKSSNDIIPDSEQKSNPSDENSSKKSSKNGKRASMEEIDPAKMGEPKLPRTAGTMSVGQYKKRIADLTKAKSYSKDQIYDIVKKLPMADMAMEKTREQVAEAMWQIYNEQLTANERREAAHDIAQFLVARLLTEAKTENPDAAEANEAMAYLRTGIGRLAFSKADRAEILHNLDKDGWRRILGRWGFKGKRNADGTLQGVRTPMEVFVTDIAREMPGMEHLEQMHPVEAFLEIDSYYSRVKEEAAEKKTSAFLYMSDEDIDSLAKSIEESIVDAYNQGGGKSIFIKRIEQGVSYYEQRAAKYREEFNEIRGRDKIHGLLMDQTQKMRDLKLRRFANITDGANETFKNIIKTLSSLQYRGNLSVTNAKKALKDLYVWYTSKEVKENLFGFTDEDPGAWQQGVAEMLEDLANDENKGFSKAGLHALLDVLSYFTHFVENFGKVWHHGEWVDAKELATGFIQVAQNQSKVKHRFVRDLLRKYMQFFGDPAAVVRLMDQYQDGFFTQIYDDLRDAAISASYAERDILATYDAFLKDHKRYVETASKETVQYRGVDIPKMHLIGLYMTMKRKHAHAGYAINGFSFKDAKGDTVRVRGSLDPDTVYTQQEIEDYVARERIKIEALLSDADKQYISILEKVYNEDAKRLKSDRDIQRFGMTNAANDYYYPIRRANAAQKLDADMQMEIDRVSSASFNKDTVAGAKQELFIESADSLFLRHVHVVCQYAYLTPVLDMQKMLYNLDISGNKNHPISIHTESQNIWPDGFKYFRELVSDVQGIPRTSSAGTRFLSALRGNYAKFQLGANPKTWLTQLSSLLASTSLLDASSVVKGLGMKSDGFTEYSKLAKLRAEDNAAAKAQGVLDNKLKRTTDTIGDALMAPIGMMDKFVVGRLFAACQVQIEKDGGAKIGSEENKIEAGKLLTRVILETQQNSLATEKSAAMRSGNEFYRSLTMFRSDSMKVIGRVIDGFGEVSAVSGMLKSKTMDEDSRKSLEARLKKAKKKTAKASVSLILSAVFMALIAQGFRWLYAKDKEEDETFAKTLLVDSLGNMIGGLPGFADVYTKLVEGYDVGNYSYSAINDVLSSAKNIFDIAEGIITGEGTAQERMRGIRNASYSLGQLLGIPTRNAYNLLYGLTKRVSPGTGYKIDSVFYEKNFKTDLEKAIEKGDDKMAMLTLQLLLGERMGENIDEAVFDELLSLSKKGMKVLPRVTPESITVNGETYEFTEDEKAAVADIYEQRNEGLGSLFASSAYKAMTDADKEKAVSVLYDLYYDKALSEALGVDRGNALLFANAIGYGKYAAFKTKIAGITSDKDKDGNTVQGSKRTKVVKAIVAMDLSREEKLLLIASSGYRLQDGDIRGISATNARRMLLKYILSIKGTQAEKAALAEACGFEVKNGKILRNSL